MWCLSGFTVRPASSPACLTVHCLRRLQKQLQEFIAKEAAAAAAGRRSKKVIVAAPAQLPTIQKTLHGALSALQPLILSLGVETPKCAHAGYSRHLSLGVETPTCAHAGYSRQWFCTVMHWCGSAACRFGTPEDPSRCPLSAW